jgi:hypothetical protein
MPGLLRFSKVAEGLPHRFRGMARTPFASMQQCHGRPAPWSATPPAPSRRGTCATGDPHFMTTRGHVWGVVA